MTRLALRIAALGLVVLPALFVPALLCGRDAGGYYAGEAEAELALDSPHGHAYLGSPLLAGLSAGLALLHLGSLAAADALGVGDRLLSPRLGDEAALLAALLLSASASRPSPSRPASRSSRSRAWAGGLCGRAARAVGVAGCRVRRAGCRRPLPGRRDEVVLPRGARGRADRSASLPRGARLSPRARGLVARPDSPVMARAARAGRLPSRLP